ncbi:hypothetical protein V5O48_018830 [Marasmius crinis-equi]|uniref:Transmembrane protein n=1 Tax=Marasmius crinis-equi TaxID=585013 RepID=A0ABR3EK30_9AGAR
MYSLHLKIDDPSPLIFYEGVWRQTNPSNENTTSQYHEKTFTVTYTYNASASFSFSGTSVEVRGGKKHDYGNYTVTIDGKDIAEMSAHANDGEESYKQPIFQVENLPQGNHTVRLTNTDTEGRGFDIDSIALVGNTRLTALSLFKQISWTSNVTSEEIEQTPSRTIYQDTQDSVKYMPEGDWGSSPKNVSKFAQRTGQWVPLLSSGVGLLMTTHLEYLQYHITSWGINEYNVHSQVVCLYGAVGPQNTRSYTVQVDSGGIHNFSARRSLWEPKKMLFYADNLGPGEHYVVVTNGYAATKTPRFTGARRQEEDVGLLEFDHAAVWNADVVTSSSTTATPTSTVTATMPSSSAGRSSLSPGAIAGITLSCIIFVGLLAVIWFLNKRNKFLWLRLQKGYMVQSQFDSQSTSPRPGQPEMGSLTNQNGSSPDLGLRPFYLNLDRNNNTSHILPIHSSSGPLNNRESALTTLENARGYPFVGFGRDRSSSKGSSDIPSSTLSSSAENPYPDSAYPARNGTPTRSGTMNTASTLVAEDGSRASSQGGAPVLKV